MYAPGFGFGKDGTAVVAVAIVVAIVVYAVIQKAKEYLSKNDIIKELGHSFDRAILIAIGIPMVIIFAVGILIAIFAPYFKT